MTIFLVLFWILSATEIIFAVLVHWLRRDFQWLITGQDESPVLDREGLKKFIAHGYDPELGWDRKPNTSKQEEVKTLGEDRSKIALSSYHINEDGARLNPGHENLPVMISTFGDSFAFSRHVNDDQTWQWHLSELTQTNVTNFGVGNYGLDQALLKMKREWTERSAKIVVMMVVPETISRILNIWKHYSEYGNTFGFKGRFIEKAGKLTWLRNPVISEDDFARLHDLLPEIQKQDECYARKFRKDVLKFPYLLHILKNPFRHLPLIGSLIIRKIFKVLKLKNEAVVNKPWGRVLARNFALTKELYRDPSACSLLKALVIEFKRLAESKDAVPIFAFVPYLHDLYEFKKGPSYYASFINSIQEELLTLDFGKIFLDVPQPESLYVSSFYGAHFSDAGNRKAAEAVYQLCLQQQLLSRLEVKVC